MSVSERDEPISAVANAKVEVLSQAIEVIVIKEEDETVDNDEIEATAASES